MRSQYYTFLILLQNALKIIFDLLMNKSLHIYMQQQLLELWSIATKVSGGEYVTFTQVPLGIGFTNRYVNNLDMKMG